MDDDAGMTIGDVARHTGLPVRTIRFYSDAGVVRESGRSEAGYRLYGLDAVGRLRLIRTLRELGIGLEAIRAILAHEATLADVAARHAEAVDAQIRTLRLQRSVLRAVAAHPDDAGALDRMHELATLTAEERRRIVGEFIEEVFAGLPEEAGVRARMEAAPPDLPEDPTPAQVTAWVELAQLVRDPDFRTRVRGMAERAGAGPAEPAFGRSPVAGKAVGEHAGRAAAAGVDPASPEALAVLERILAVAGEPPDRLALAEQLTTFTDRRVGRYWQLLGIINGWPPVPDVIPAWEWFARALRAHPHAPAR
jgi:DNA-binding transcriptional MerR regulator